MYLTKQSYFVPLAVIFFVTTCYCQTSFPILDGNASQVCDPPYNPLKPGYTVAMNRDGMVRNAQDFCSRMPNTDVEFVSQSYNPWGPTGTDNVTGYMTMTFAADNNAFDEPYCAQGVLNEETCLTIFMSIIDNCDTTTVQTKRGGTVSTNCTYWSLLGAGGADLYNLHFHQVMVDDIANVE